MPSARVASRCRRPRWRRGPARAMSPPTEPGPTGRTHRDRPRARPQEPSRCARRMNRGQAVEGPIARRKHSAEHRAVRRGRRCAAEAPDHRSWWCRSQRPPARLGPSAADHASNGRAAQFLSGSPAEGAAAGHWRHQPWVTTRRVHRHFNCAHAQRAWPMSAAPCCEHTRCLRHGLISRARHRHPPRSSCLPVPEPSCDYRRLRPVRKPAHRQPLAHRAGWLAQATAARGDASRAGAVRSRRRAEVPALPDNGGGVAQDNAGRRHRL